MRVSAKVIQDLDRLAIDHTGIPSLVLMENAGRAVAQEVMRQLKGKRKKPVSIVCGLGNNAGDGFVAARYLLNEGIEAKVFFIGKEQGLKNDAAVNASILKRLGYSIREIKKIDASFVQGIRQSAVIVDAIFGVGLNRWVEDPFRRVILVLNQEAKKIISVDVPSGLNSTTGEIYGVCVKAHTTVTFTLPKKGFYLKQGPYYVGKVRVVDIGIPRKLLRKI